MSRIVFILLFIGELNVLSLFRMLLISLAASVMLIVRIHLYCLLLNIISSQIFLLII
jgi:hypothetical protein